jgi:hypothetical protein
MKGPTISGVGGYTAQPDKVFQTVIAGEALIKGQVVMWSTTAEDGMTVLRAAGATSFVAGVTESSAASGALVRIQTRGFCDYLATDNSVANDGLLLPSATAGLGDTAAVGNYTFGIAFEDDANDAISAGVGLLTASVLFCR